MNNQADASHWGRYWAAGPVTSLPQDFAGNYDGELAEFWSRQFGALAGSPCRVLDVCTGNGAVAMLAAKQLPEAEIAAVDIAPIDPPSALTGHPELKRLAVGIRFVGNCPVETVDTQFGEFDLITSQYGFEYSDWSAAAGSVFRALKPRGRLALVVHSPDSAMVERMAAEYEQYQQLQHSGFTGCLMAFVEDAQTSDVALFRSQVREAVGRFQAGRNSAVGAELIAGVAQAGQGLLMMTDAQIRSQAGAMANYAAELDAGSKRLGDMLAVNRALLESPEWYRVFEAEGLALLERGSLRYKGQHHCGNTLVFSKPD